MATKCTVCGTSPAYISFWGSCECSSPTCEKYSEALYGNKPDTKARTTEEAAPEMFVGVTPQSHHVEGTVDVNQYTWSSYHNDFGDID